MLSYKPVLIIDFITFLSGRILKKLTLDWLCTTGSSGRFLHCSCQFSLLILIVFVFCVVHLEMPCTNFVNVKNLDLIVVVERNLNTYLQKKLNTQLAHMVNMICEKKFDFRLALVCYKDHTTSPLPNAHTQWFTKDKDDMKTRIRGLQPSETVGFSHGLADGLDLALKLAINSGGDDLMCRKDASKVCILLREYGLKDYIFLH